MLRKGLRHFWHLVYVIDTWHDAFFPFFFLDLYLNLVPVVASTTTGLILLIFLAVYFHAMCQVA